MISWWQRPLLDPSPASRVWRFYALFLLLIALGSPVLHGYLDIPLSASEIAAHTLIVLAAVTLAVLLIEAAAALIAGRAKRLSTGGFLLRVAGAYVLSGLAVGPMHAVWPFTRAIMEKHASAGPGSVWGHVLPLALFITFVVYQVMRKDYLARQVEELRQVNRDLEAVRQARLRSAKPLSAPVHVRFGGIDLPLAVESILRIQADENYCHVVTTAGDAGPQRHLVRMTLSEAAHKLPRELFVQTHRSHLVNLRAVAELLRDGRRCELRLSSGERVPVSRGRVASVRARIRDFLTANELATPARVPAARHTMNAR